MTMDGPPQQQQQQQQRSPAGSSEYARFSFESQNSRPSTRARMTATPSYMNATRVWANHTEPFSPSSDRASAIPWKDGAAPISPVSKSASVKMPGSMHTPAVRGVLLIIIAEKVDPALKGYLEVLLQRHAFSEVAIVGLQPEEQALKHLKNEVYGLAGRHNLELGVLTCLYEDWRTHNVENAVTQAVGFNSADNRLQGIICCAPLKRTRADDDVLALEPQQLGGLWTMTVGFLHAVCKSAMARLTQSSATRKFFYLSGVDDGRRALSFEQQAMVAIVDNMRRVKGPFGITFGYAEQDLHPEAMKGQGHANGTNGKLAVKTNFSYPQTHDQGEGDSPTRLWGMWANANAANAI